MATQAGLRDRLEQDYREALKSRDASRVSVIRMVKAALQNEDKARQSPLSEDDVVGVIVKEAKVRREAMTEFERGGRHDLAEQEAAALQILQTYLPQQLTQDELRAIVAEAVAALPPETAANPNAATGMVMRSVMPRVKGRAEGSAVNAVVREMLAGRSAR